MSQGAVIQQDFRTFDFLKKLGHLGAEIIGFLRVEIGFREKLADSGNASLDTTKAEEGFGSHDKGAVGDFRAGFGGHREFLLADADHAVKVFSRHALLGRFIKKFALVRAWQCPHGSVMRDREIPLTSFRRERTCDRFVIVGRSSRHFCFVKRADDELVGCFMIRVCLEPQQQIGEREVTTVPYASRNRNLSNLFVVQSVRQFQASSGQVRNLIRQVGQGQAKWLENLLSILKREFLSHFPPPMSLTGNDG